MKPISAELLKKRLEQGEVIVIDVREPAEYRAEHIEGAHLIPLGRVTVAALPSVSCPVVIHCRSGARSTQACKKLFDQDSSLDLYNLDGGIMAWKDAGFAVKKSGGWVLPLDRQTQVAAGFFIATGTILGATVSPEFYIVPGLMGFGLMSAGLTGWCGLARLLAKMPWNH